MRLRTPVPLHALRSVAALAGAGTLVALAAAPGVAAQPVAQADATALVLTVLNTPNDSGTVKATHDGRDETVTGTRNPIITVLDNQSFITAGTLAQDADATVVDRAGRSAACAGLAGDGATLAAVEDGGFCLDPGQNATINAGTFELEDVTILEADILGGLPPALQAALQPLLDQVFAVDGPVQTVLEGIGDPTVGLDLGAIQSQCTATVTAAEGDSQLTDASLFLDFPSFGELALVELPTNPPPNTKLVTDLDVVLTTISDGLETQLEVGLGGLLGQGSPLLNGVVEALNENIVSQLADQLAPLEENILDGTLNKQTTGDRSIEVTALDLRVLPAAAAEGLDVLNVEIGRSSCGTNSRVGNPQPTPTPTDPGNPGNPGNPGDPGSPAVPTSVPAGDLDALSGTSGDGAINGQVATGALVVLTLLAAAGGVHVFRRVLGS